MKNDRDFLDGIYKKAAAYDKDEISKDENVSFSWKCYSWFSKRRIPATLTTGIAVCAILLIVGIHNGASNKVESPIDKMNIDYEINTPRIVREMEEPETFGITGIDQEGLLDYDNIKVLGAVSNVYAEGNQVVVDLTVIKSNDINISSDIINIYYTPINSQDESMFVHGEELIVVLSKESGEDYYTLENLKDNVYHMKEGSAEGKTFISLNGTFIEEDEVVK